MATNLFVPVFDGNVQGALQTLKKQMITRGIFKEMKKRAYYEKPSLMRRRKQEEARKKERKRMRPIIEREARLEAQGR